MANNFQALIKQHYSRALQALLAERLIAMDLANTMLKERLPDGNRVNFPRPQYQTVDEYTKYTDVSDQDVVTENEFLDIDKTPLISFVIDDIDDMENGWDIVSNTIENSFYMIKKSIEWNFFKEVVNAQSGNNAAIALDANNVVDTFGTAYAELVNEGVDESNIVAVVDPFVINTIGIGALGNTYNVADEAFKKGYRGTFQNMTLAISTNLRCTGALALNNAVTADDTVTINGVVFTFKTALSTWPAVAGEVLAGANAAASRANLIAAINGAAGAGTTYTPVAKPAKLEGITASEVGTTVAITSLRGYKKVSQTLTNAANKWGALVIECPIMQRGSIHLVMQKEPGLKVQDVQKQLGTRYMLWSRYGIKTFTQGAERMYNLKVVAQVAE